MSIRGKDHHIVRATHCALCEALIAVTEEQAAELEGKANRLLCSTCVALMQGALTVSQKLMLARAAKKAVIVDADGGITCPNCAKPERFGYTIKFFGPRPHRALTTCTKCLTTFEVRESGEDVQAIAPDGLIPFVADALASADADSD